MLSELRIVGNKTKCQMVCILQSDFNASWYFATLHNTRTLLPLFPHSLHLHHTSYSSELPSLISCVVSWHSVRVFSTMHMLCYCILTEFALWSAYQVGVWRFSGFARAETTQRQRFWTFTGTHTTEKYCRSHSWVGETCAKCKLEQQIKHDWCQCEKVSLYFHTDVTSRWWCERPLLVAKQQPYRLSTSLLASYWIIVREAFCCSWHFLVRGDSASVGGTLDVNTCTIWNYCFLLVFVFQSGVWVLYAVFILLHVKIILRI